MTALSEILSRDQEVAMQEPEKTPTCQGGLLDDDESWGPIFTNPI